MAQEVDYSLEELKELALAWVAIELSKVNGYSAKTNYLDLSHYIDDGLISCLPDRPISDASKETCGKIQPREIKIAESVNLRTGSESISFLTIPVPTPFAINIANVEYCKGRMNPDTNRYELKIGLVSGRDLTLEGEAAMSFLSTISENYSTDVDGSKSLKAKFQSKSGS